MVARKKYSLKSHRMMENLSLLFQDVLFYTLHLQYFLSKVFKYVKLSPFHTLRHNKPSPSPHPYLSPPIHTN